MSPLLSLFPFLLSLLCLRVSQRETRARQDGFASLPLGLKGEERQGEEGGREEDGEGDEGEGMS